MGEEERKERRGERRRGRRGEEREGRRGRRGKRRRGKRGVGVKRRGEGPFITRLHSGFILKTIRITVHVSHTQTNDGMIMYK